MKKIVFTMKDFPTYFIIGEFDIEKEELKFKHILYEDLFLNVEDVGKDFSELFEEDNKIWEDLIEKIKNEINLIDKIKMRINEEIIFIQY